MKKLFSKWNAIPLILRIAVGIVVGVILGVALPSAGVLSIFGDVFVCIAAAEP